MTEPAGPAGTLRVTPSDVGRRVMLRHELPAGGTHRWTDVLGDLADWSGGILRVVRRDGSTALIDESALVAGKVVPPAPPRRRAPTSKDDQ